MVVGKGPLADMMKVISVKENLSDVYTNHCIRKTTGTAMHKSGASLKEISFHMKQKKLQSLQNYVAGPTMEDKERYTDMLYNFTKPKETTEQSEINKENKPEDQIQLEVTPAVPNVTEDNAIIPLESNFNEISKKVSQPVTTSNLVQNTQNQSFRQAPIMFQGATFTNCQITLNVPK